MTVVVDKEKVEFEAVTEETAVEEVDEDVVIVPLLGWLEMVLVSGLLVVLEEDRI